MSSAIDASTFTPYFRDDYGASINADNMRLTCGTMSLVYRNLAVLLGMDHKILYHLTSVPALVWVRRAVPNSSPDSDDSHSAWTIMDSKRLSYNGLTPNHLYANHTATEGKRGDASGTSSLTDMTLGTSNGFYLNGPGTEVNANTGTYIYCAWAEAPSIDLFGGGANAR